MKKFIFILLITVITTNAEVLINPGSFLMGGNFDARAPVDSDELPQHFVTISHSFFISKNEITIKEYCNFLNNKSSWINYQTAAENGAGILCNGVINFSGAESKPLVWLPIIGNIIAESGGVWSPNPISKSNHPMVNVTWFGAALFCNYLSERDLLVPIYSTNTWECDWSIIGETNSGYHLPSEAQWEFAARGGNYSNAFPWGQNLVYENCNIFKSVDSFDYENDSIYPCTTQVGNFSPNANGIFDVIGNVAEWCDDWYNPKFYTNSSSIDPICRLPSTFLVGGTNKVLRGGSWAYSPKMFPNLSARAPWNQSVSDIDIGFRIVREPQLNFDVTPKKLDFSFDLNSLNFDIINLETGTMLYWTNYINEISGGTGWVSISKTTGLNNATINVKIDRNSMSTSDGIAEIRVASIDSELIVTIEAVPEPFLFINFYLFIIYYRRRKF